MYVKEDLFKKAIKVIEDEPMVIFIDDVVTRLACARSTFYEYFPSKSDEHKEILSKLEKNRLDIKITLRSSWLISSAPAVQIALMKLTANEDELKRLSVQYNETDITSKGNELKTPQFTWANQIDNTKSDIQTDHDDE